MKQKHPKDHSLLPYFYSLEKDGAVLFFVGIQHSYDPSHPQFEVIKEKWWEFLGVAKDPAVVVEAKAHRVYKDEEKTIVQEGESGLVTLLADKEGVPVLCFKPGRDEEMNAVADKFSKEKAIYYYFARTVDQWYRLKAKPDIEKYLLYFLDYYKKASGWKNIDFSIQGMAKIHKKLFGGEMDLNNADFFKKISNPMRDDNPLQGVVWASRTFRHQVVVKEIKKLWSKGKDLFIVYGKGHAREFREELEQQ